MVQEKWDTTFVFAVIKGGNHFFAYYLLKQYDKVIVTTQLEHIMISGTI
jgi:hypothetical protein